MKEGSRVGRCRGVKMRRKNNSRPSWKTGGKLKVEKGEAGRWICNRTTTGRERKSGW